MGKTYRRGDGKGNFDDNKQSGRRGKHTNHAHGRGLGGMRIINEYDEFYSNGPGEFDDNITVGDNIRINKTGEDN